MFMFGIIVLQKNLSFHRLQSSRRLQQNFPQDFSILCWAGFTLKKRKTCDSHPVCISFSELSDYISVHSTRPSDVSVSNVPGAKCQGGLWVSSHQPYPWPLLRVSARQPASWQHPPQRRHLRDHRRPQEEQRQPGHSHSVPAHLGPAGWWEAFHLHLQGLPGQQLEGEQHGRPSQWVPFTSACYFGPCLLQAATETVSKVTFCSVAGILPICSAISVMFKSAPWLLSLVMSLPVAVGLLSPWIVTFTG